MTKLASLNNVDHADLKLMSVFGLEASVNQVLVFPNEFEHLQRCYPILFRQEADSAWQAVAILGLDRDENLFLEDGAWRSPIVPALLQRGPFSIAVPALGEGDARPTIHVDLDDPRISRTEGQPLFRDHGGNSQVLDRVAAVLRTIYSGVELMPAMFAAFTREELLEQATLTIEVGDQRHYRLDEYWTISADRLRQLGGAALERLHRAGFLAPAFAAAGSLANFSTLIDLKRERGYD